MFGKWFITLTATAGLALAGCRALGEDDTLAKSLSIVEPTGYWSVRAKDGENNRIRPVVRFRVRNNGTKPADYIQAMAVFRRESAPDESWSNAFQYSIPGGAIAPGALAEEVTLRGDSSYFSKEEPEKMLENKAWEKVMVEVFLKVRSSRWISMGKLEVPRRLGAPGVEQFTTPARPSEPARH